MPSSPGPNEYKRTLQRFFYRGISLVPQDALPEGKAAFALNIRSHEEGTWEPRYGQTLAADTVLPGPIHSIFRLNDTTPFADVGAPSRRLVGSDVGLYGGTPGSATLSLADTGYSGDPMTGVVCPPFASPRPFLYIGDSARLRKINSSFNDMPIGIAQPILPPEGELAVPETVFLNTVGVAAWTAYGGDTTPAAPTPAPFSDRVNTVITDLIFDSGVDGMCSVVVADFNNFTPGMTAEIGPSTETAIIQDILPAIASTTIAAILYDSGTTGLCTIQPEGSFSAGQIELPDPEQIRRRYADLNTPAPPPVTVTRTVDYPVNALVSLNGVETVRIQSIAIGPDGVQSFRCYTFGTYAAGDTIDGLPSFRAFCQTAWGIGDTVSAVELDVTLTPLNDTDSFIGGVQSPLSGGWRNWATIFTRATQPEDIIRFGIKVSGLGYVESVRLVLDLSPTGPAFLKDYYFYEWRASDLVTAIQATSEITTGLVADAQADAVRQGLVTGLYTDQYGQQRRRGTVQAVDSDLAVSREPSDDAEMTGREAVPRTSREAIARAAPVPVGGGVARQLALGNDAWMTLECRVGDLMRVGTDTTLSLTRLLNALITVQTKGTTVPLTLSFSDVYLTGGYGPDVASTLPPYVYRYSYRSTITGEKSNPSPPMRAGLLPRRGRVELNAFASLDPQCDVIDWWKFGGALARWAYVGTAPNTTADFHDDMADRMIDGGQGIWVDQYQPFPVSDLPRSGTALLAGTALEWVSGDTFNPLWAADTLIVVNGRATQLYMSPASTTRLEVVDNCGSGTVDFYLPSPTILSQPLPAIWGGPIGNAWYTFACGDPTDPGVLHWTNPGDPDASNEANVLVASTASDPLLNGFFDNGVPYVWSTSDLLRIVPVPGDRTPFRVISTNCGRGLWSRWAMCLDPDGGCYFLAKDGIYFTGGGGAAISLTGPDLQPLFPQEGTTPEAIRNLNPIDMTQTTKLVLAFVDQVLYFDYVDTEGEEHTLVYEPRYKRWTPDTYAVGATARLGEPGPQVETHLLGGSDGRLRQVDSNSLVDVDASGDLADIDWAYWTVWAHGEDPRAFKQWGDAILDFNPGGSQDGILVTPVVDNGNVALTQQTIGLGGTVRDTFLVEVGAGGEVGYGVLSRNFGLWIEGAVQACDTQRPIFYLWEPAYLWKGTSVGFRATDWEDLGYKGAKFIQGVVIRANTFGVAKAVEVQFDGPNGAPQLGVTLSLLHDGEQSIAYPQADTGWQPFHGQLVRLQGIDDNEWTLLDWRFVWEPAPELATQWETQDTTFDLPGFLDVRDGVMAYAATQDVELAVWHDDIVRTYVLPATLGEYARAYVLFSAEKGKSVRFQWSSDAPFRLYKRDCSVRVQGWGIPGGYQVVNPFGGPSRVSGAEI